MPLTEYQELAAESRGGSRLVSAAAGSGKTTVLVERLLRRVIRGADIDDFLVVTYTRAAAGELRSRIARELTEAQARDPRNLHLRRQTQLVVRAGIGDCRSSATVRSPPQITRTLQTAENASVISFTGGYFTKTM